MSQGTRCSKTAETGESVSLGRSKKREDRTVNGALERYTSSTTLGAMGQGVKRYNKDAIIELMNETPEPPFIALDTCVYSA